MAADKIAIVTGAGTGVGRAASLALMKIGYTVVLAGRRLNMLEETQKLGAEFGGKSLPVSADLERGKGDSAEQAAETIFAAEAAGLAGCSIEDHTGDPDKPIYDFSHAVERVAAAVEAARALKRDFVFTARAENFLWGKSDLDDTIKRLQAFEKAGADVLYAPGIGDVEMVRTVCSAVGKPVNVMARPGFTIADLAMAGVKRISLGPWLTNFAYGMLETAAREIQQDGTFGFTRAAMPFGKLQALFAKSPA